MPFSTPGAGDALGVAIIAAQDAVAAAFAAAHPDPGSISPADMLQLRADMATALGNAINAHLIAFGVASVLPSSGTPPGFPGSIG